MSFNQQRKNSMLKKQFNYQHEYSNITLYFRKVLLHPYLYLRHIIYFVFCMWVKIEYYEISNQFVLLIDIRPI